MAKSNVENLSPHVIKQISKELSDLIQNPIEGIRVVFNEDNVTSIQADIDGPLGTPYHGGSFRIRLLLGKNFPTTPPKSFFVTKIFHPNVGRNGEICVNTLKKDWNQDLGIKHILLTVKCLMIVPNPESALNEEAGKMLLDQYDDYCRRAKMMTEIHAPKAKISSDDAGNESSCQAEPSSSSISNNIVATNSNSQSNNNSNNNNSTLFDKTTSSSTTANRSEVSSSGGSGQGQKQPLDGIGCSDEPLAKKLNLILDCYNSTTADQPSSITQQQPPPPNSQQQSAPSQRSSTPSSQQSSSSSPSSSSSTQSKSLATSATVSSKNRGLKRVLRLRS